MALIWGLAKPEINTFFEFERQIMWVLAKQLEKWETFPVVSQLQLSPFSFSVDS